MLCSKMNNQQSTMSTQYEKKEEVCKNIRYLNMMLLEPDSLVWGELTEDEADDVFNDENNELHQEWGTKSHCMLEYIRCKY